MTTEIGNKRFVVFGFKKFNNLLIFKGFSDSREGVQLLVDNDEDSKYVYDFYVVYSAYQVGGIDDWKQVWFCNFIVTTRKVIEIGTYEPMPKPPRYCLSNDYEKFYFQYM